MATDIGRAARWLLVIVLVAAVGIKIALLLTSQSMADGDEAVEGLMGLHILQGHGHPIYPYGIRYGAGAGVEAHLAAIAFLVLGVSSPALKSVGLFLWCLDVLLVGAIGRRLGGATGALAAMAVFASSPAAAQWSLKVAGGHQVAVTLCLLMILLIERGVRPAAVASLAPLAAFAHPVALPFAGLAAGYVVVRGPRRLETTAAFLASTVAAVVLLYPTLPQEQETWNPILTRLQPIASARALTTALVGFFSPNLNAAWPPQGMLLVVALAWLAAFVVAVVRFPQRRFVLYALSVPLVVFLVAPAHLTARHLIVLQPVACLIIGLHAVASRGRGPLTTLAVLILLGLAVQLNELRSPFVYGAGRQADGLERNEVRTILRRLRDGNVRYVYSAEPMLQWMLTFESRERIIARGRDPHDRVPEYARQVDEARRRGERVALVFRTGETTFAVVPNPPAEVIDASFPSLETAR